MSSSTARKTPRYRIEYEYEPKRWKQLDQAPRCNTKALALEAMRDLYIFEQFPHDLRLIDTDAMIGDIVCDAAIVYETGDSRTGQ